jgi:NhaA family Na+:H+ antiporter
MHNEPIGVDGNHNARRGELISKIAQGSQPPPIERVIRPFQAFARHKLSGAGLLLLATAGALVWANSPWSESYHHLLETEISLKVGGWAISKHLLHWINDGLMGIFFFVVGLEIKREALAGELASPRKAVLPIAGAIGGMVVPAVVYLTLNAGGPGAHGWGVPVATDIAFALGIMALLGDRVPVGLKVFLTALAIVDDIGAILVIAVFYTDQIVLTSLLAGGLVFLVSIVANVSGVRNPIVYFILGMVVWLAFLSSGIHATLAAVLMAFTIPARSRLQGETFLSRMESLLVHLRAMGVPGGRRLLAAKHLHVLHEMERVLERSTPPLQDLEHVLAPLVTFVVLPVFALANAGVTLGGGLTESLSSPVGLGIVLGLFLGKQVGITAFSWLAVKLKLADLPSGVGWGQLHAVSILGGIGFTMSLFVSGLAFSTPQLADVSKIAILSASLISGVTGWLLLRFVWKSTPGGRD